MLTAIFVLLVMVAAVLGMSWLYQHSHGVVSCGCPGLLIIVGGMFVVWFVATQLAKH